MTVRVTEEKRGVIEIVDRNITSGDVDQMVRMSEVNLGVDLGMVWSI